MFVVLHGTLSEIAQAEGLGEFPAGDRNVLRVAMEDVSGSGPRANVYVHVLGPVKPENHGAGNRLELTGDAASFGRSNHDIDPVAGARFFIGTP